MLTIFGAMAELEREYILQRQREGIAIAKEQGVYKGRKPIERPMAGGKNHSGRGHAAAEHEAEYILSKGQDCTIKSE